MSTPSVNKPGDSIPTQVANFIGNAINYVSDTITGNASEAKKEAGKEQAKGHIPGHDSLTDRVSGAADAVSGALDESKYKASAEVNKQGI